MRFCPNCGTAVPAGTTTCPQCNAALPYSPSSAPTYNDTNSEANAETQISTPNLPPVGRPGSYEQTQYAPPPPESRGASVSSPAPTSYTPQTPSSPYYGTTPAATPPAYQNQPSSPYFNSASTYPNQYYPQQNAFTPQPPRPRQKRPLPVVIAIIAVVLIVMGSGIYLIAYATAIHPAQLRAQATATVQAQQTADAQVTGTAVAQSTATAIAQANSTATAVAQATAQAQATATALQNIYTQSTKGDPALTSSLAGADNANWDTYDAVGGGGCAFTGGALHASVFQKNYYVPCFAQATNFGNFTYQVEMTIVKGNEGGIIFRANDKTSQFYFFRISRDGSYALSVSKDDRHNTSILYDNSSAIKTGLGDKNLITVVARGNTLYLYVNKQYISNVVDNSYASGKIGVFASDNSSETDVAFTNVQIWTL